MFPILAVVRNEQRQRSSHSFTVFNAVWNRLVVANHNMSAVFKCNGIKTAIADGMTANRLYTVTELIKEIPECAELTNQRVSALLRQMIADGTVVKTVDKRKSYFQIVE